MYDYFLHDMNEYFDNKVVLLTQTQQSCINKMSGADIKNNQTTKHWMFNDFQNISQQGYLPKKMKS